MEKLHDAYSLAVGHHGNTMMFKDIFMRKEFTDIRKFKGGDGMTSAFCPAEIGVIKDIGAAYILEI